jgi:hypothetical protein
LYLYILCHTKCNFKYKQTIDPANMATTETATQGAYSPPDSVSPMVEDIESFPRIHTGVEKAPALNTDPFAGQHETVNPFPQNGDKAKADSPSSPVDRRTSTDEWGMFLFLCQSLSSYVRLNVS